MPSPQTIAFLAHILSALFWMGSSFMVAQAKGQGAGRQYAPQMLALVLAFASGGYLWWFRHWGLFGPMEWVLAFGVACAVIAAGIQGMVVGGALRRLRGGAAEAEARLRIKNGHRAIAGLLAAALLAMMAAHLAPTFL